MNKTEVLHMITSQEIKAMAKRMGADIVGIGSIDRWSTAPIQMDPKQIMPKAKSIIALGFRVLRGSLRGIEEGTYFSNYSAMGYGGITYLYMPMTVINLSKMIEDEGYEAVPMGHQSDWRGIDNDGNIRENYSKPVEPGKPQPDIMLHLRICAYLAGLASSDKNGFVIRAAVTNIASDGVYECTFGLLLDSDNKKYAALLPDEVTAFTAFTCNCNILKNFTFGFGSVKNCVFSFIKSISDVISHTTINELIIFISICMFKITTSI